MINYFFYKRREILFSFGFFHGGIFFYGSFSFGATSSGFGSFLSFGGSGISFVVIHELDNAHFSVVTLSEAGFKDTGISTGA